MVPEINPTSCWWPWPIGFILAKICIDYKGEWDKIFVQFYVLFRYGRAEQPVCEQDMSLCCTFFCYQPFLCVPKLYVLSVACPRCVYPNDEGFYVLSGLGMRKEGIDLWSPGFRGELRLRLMKMPYGGTSVDA